MRSSDKSWLAVVLFTAIMLIAIYIVAAYGATSRAADKYVWDSHSKFRVNECMDLPAQPGTTARICSVHDGWSDKTWMFLITGNGVIAGDKWGAVAK